MTIEEYFPNLPSSGFQRVSEATENYNCIAWAAGHNDIWWDIAEGYYWPDDVPRVNAIENLEKVYERIGYVKCQSREPEKGIEKIAIYGEAPLFTHAARQLETGKWTSKIGNLEDIEHDSLEGLCGEEYGQVILILKREIDGTNKGKSA